MGREAEEVAERQTQAGHPVPGQWWDREGVCGMFARPQILRFDTYWAAWASTEVQLVSYVFGPVFVV